MASVYTGIETLGRRIGGMASAPLFIENIDVKWDDKYDPDAPLVLEPTDIVGTFIASVPARLSDATKGYMAIVDDRLTYISQSANFTIGSVITGATSGATATIVYDEDAGTTGRLTLKDVDGTFVTGEVITDAETVAGTATTAVVKPAIRVYEVSTTVLVECAKDVDLTGVSARIAIIQC